jgi:hypothetical protein
MAPLANVADLMSVHHGGAPGGAETLNFDLAVRAHWRQVPLQHVVTLHRHHQGNGRCRRHGQRQRNKRKLLDHRVSWRALGNRCRQSRQKEKGPDQPTIEAWSLFPGALLRGLTRHGVFDQSDHDGHDRTGDAPAYGLPDNGADIDIPGSSGEHRQECCENLPTANAAERTRDRVAGRSEIVVLDPVACSIPADSACYQLDDDVDYRR